MSTPDDDFLRSLQATFKVEAAEHLQAIVTGLLDLEKSPSSEAGSVAIATIFRAAHSLKGAARAVGYAEIESHCQALEEQFAGWRRAGGMPSADALDQAHRAGDAIGAILNPPEAPAPLRALAPLLEPVAAPAAPPMPASPMTEPVRIAADETVRISVGKLEARLVEAEELLMAKQTAGRRAADLRDLARQLEAWRSEWTAAELTAHTLRRAGGNAAARNDPELARLVEFVERGRDRVKGLEGLAHALARLAQQDRHEVGKLVDDLLEDSKKLLLLPFGSLTAAFPKLVRDLAREQGKEVELTVQGEDVELDKRILEEMKDAFVHLLRNCLDHGIEPAADRIRAGKPVRATIAISAASVDGNKVELLVSDDGAGVDRARVKAAALKHGRISAEEAERLDEGQTLDLIFRPDVSTSAIVTTLSGRGLGLAIVREKAEKLGGHVTVASESGRGTRFRLVLPTLLATFRGILVEVAAQAFVVPTAHVERVGHVAPGDIRTVEGRETVTLNGRTVSLVRLAEVLGISPAAVDDAAPGKIVFLLLGSGDERVAAAVDAVLDEQEVLVKPLRKPLVRVRHFSGATVLGSGRIAPVLHVADLLKSARESGASPRRAVPAAAPKAKAAKAVLVAEDSITSRMLLKGMLESAGYRVAVAADGMEAFTQLRGGQFDLLVSDIEMPRLNGFELTARIRADRKLAELPVVLVTGLETREDRERGIDVGASAYLVKSSLEESNLLEIVRQLI